MRHVLSRVAVIHIATLRVITEVLTKVGGATVIGQEGVGLLVFGRKGWSWQGGVGLQVFSWEGWSYRCLVGRGGATGVW